MKTRIITTALFIIIASFSLAASPQRFLKMYDTKGQILLMPVKGEEAVDSLPFDLHKEFLRAIKADASRMFDLSGMIPPEEEADDIPCSLRQLFPHLTAK
jgi:hypothetical protein